MYGDAECLLKAGGEQIGRSEIVTGLRLEWKFAVGIQNNTTFRHFRDWYGYSTKIGVSVRALYARDFAIYFYNWFNR